MLSVPWRPWKRLVGLGLGLSALKFLLIAAHVTGLPRMVAAVSVATLAYLAAVFCFNRQVLVADSASLSVRCRPFPWQSAIVIPWSRIERVFVSRRRVSEPTSGTEFAYTMRQAFHLLGIVDGRPIRLLHNIPGREAAESLQRAIEAFIDTLPAAAPATKARART